jgi:hypothetical protein
MRSIILTALLLSAAAPASAQLNAYYRGVQLVDGKEIPSTAEFSIEKGRVAMVLKGAHSFRLLFVESDHVLRMVDDEGKTYFDLGKGGALPGDPMEEMRKQLEKLPPEQRAMAEQSMAGIAAMQTPAPTTYVWSEEHKTIGGYDCTRVDVMRGGEKRAEYWGTNDHKFRMSDAEHHTMLAMQESLRRSPILVRAGGGSDGDGARVFQWDTTTEGCPIVTRCLDAGTVTLDLKLESTDRKPLSKDLFEISGYAKQDFSGQGRKHKHGD